MNVPAGRCVCPNGHRNSSVPTFEDPASVECLICKTIYERAT